MWLDWISLLIRWFHVIAGVAWIGASFYFIWLDNHLETPPRWKQDKGIGGDLWAIHGGGFYEVAKYRHGPEQMPPKLHWFKWEAYSTWLSGMLLLGLIYYLGASSYLIDPSVRELSPGVAVLLGLGFIFGFWLLYELPCRFGLYRKPLLLAGYLVGLLSLATFIATSLFSGRGAYIHVGALIGTIMAGNVFMQIIPAQRKMVAAVARGESVNPEHGFAAKQRSVHNNYLTLPLLFLMISNHYPLTYQHEQNALVLLAMIGLGAWIRHFFNLRHQGQFRPSILASGAAGAALLGLWLSWPAATPTAPAAPGSPRPIVSEQQIQSIVSQRCQSCHSTSPTDSLFPVAPAGVILDKWAQIERWQGRIIARTVVRQDMPFANKTGMTTEERNLLAHWARQ